MYLNIKSPLALADGANSTTSFACRNLNAIAVGKTTVTAVSGELLYLSCTSNGNTIINEIPFQTFQTLSQSNSQSPAAFGTLIPFGSLPVNGTCELSITNESGASVSNVSAMAIIDNPGGSYNVFSKYQSQAFSGNSVSKVLYIGDSTSASGSTDIVTVQIGKRTSAVSLGNGHSLLSSLGNLVMGTTPIYSNSNALLYAGLPAKLSLNGPAITGYNHYLVQSVYRGK